MSSLTFIYDVRIPIAEYNPLKTNRKSLFINRTSDDNQSLKTNPN